MSGQLVGEVIAGAAELKARGITDRGFMALIAIAEKCHHQTRQGSVRWAWIQAGLFGSSKRTAERAVAELKSAGIVQVSKVGFSNRYLTRAPIYSIAPLLDTDTAMSASPVLDTDTAMSQPRVLDTDKSVLDTDTQGVVLDGSINGSINGTTKSITRAPKSERAHRLPEGWEPPTAVMTELRERWPLIDLADALEEFHDYWRGISGTRGRNLDWAGTFRNRIRALDKRRLETEERNNRFRGNGSNGRTESAYERKKRIALEIHDSFDDPDNLKELA